MTEPWWQRATGYQIWPRSFQDSNGDGIGDIPGILSRLDHLEALGVDFVWLSPVYASPQADMGYDIADYRAIAPEYGTMADMDRLIAEAGARGIRIVMDLVVNHSSDEHAWFQAARGDRSAPTRDFYIWRDPAPDGGPPTDMQSIFGGPAWTLDEGSGQYYLHLFDRKQPDLNWTNPALRAEIWDMMTWWLDRGIGGFRMDVIELIGKDPDRGITTNGPKLHDYLSEMRAKVLDGRDAIAIAEAWAAGTEDARRYCETLSMVFQFSHILAGWHPELGKWHPLPHDLAGLKRVLFDWQEALEGAGWNSLFWGNHDLPRAVSRYGSETHRGASAKALATVLHLLKGTPFIYQGEEIGMTNAGFTRIDQYRDVETLNFHALRAAEGGDMAAFLAGAAQTARDNSRTPVQWEAGPQAGFTTGAPWIGLAHSHPEVHAQADRADPEGVFARYRALTDLRRTSPIVRHGRTVPQDAAHPQVFAYTREHPEGRIAVAANLGDAPLRWTVPEHMRGTGTPLFGGPALLGETLDFAPWEVVALRA
ncbi:glycoside hydrolase family 13 protein [Jannaschia seohaensis]|uniref:Oligo-1,6-glucosidase n=1 Tax=Jannaschia seohaensis TaxID=475081 RepID=A0A2Y9AAK8_9RHOB|nr:alpha-glucosidase [Jannaschia seohaensis]PWJ21201.1 oligo-1,6-glucosidase [Jannaschia seohaensis]SSA41611.1 oligo-1,6-glucosidase [Jannaschia seohaensis]